MDAKSATADKRVAGIARRQYGVVSIGQLRRAGVTRDAVRRRVGAGRLHRVHQGVYAVGHSSLSREGKWMAAILASGGEMAARDAEGTAPQGARTILDRWGAAISHRSAAELWGLLSLNDGPVDVSVPTDGGRRRRRGIRLHRCLSLLPACVGLRKGIPVTTPERTIADLRRTVSSRGKQGLISPGELRRAIRQAGVLGLSLGSDAVTDRTRSELEYLFLSLCRRYRLPAPEVKVRLGSLEVDFLWRDRRLVVETDGYKYHRGRAAFENDHDRDLRLRAAGYDTIRLSYRQVLDDPERVAEVLTAYLATCSAYDRISRHTAP